MSRRATDKTGARQRGSVYVMHLDPPYKHARHYRGFAREGRLEARIAEEQAGGANAARLMQVQHAAGGSSRVGRVYEDVTRDREIEVKEAGAARHCAICKAERAETRIAQKQEAETGKQAEAERELEI